MKFEVGQRVSTQEGAGKIRYAYPAEDGNSYGVELERKGVTLLYFEEEISLIRDQEQYHIPVEIDVNAGTVTVAFLQGDLQEDKRVICRGYARIIRNDENGIMQAVSFAMKKMYEKMGGFQGGQ